MGCDLLGLATNTCKTDGKSIRAVPMWKKSISSHTDMRTFSYRQRWELLEIRIREDFQLTRKHAREARRIFLEGIFRIFAVPPSL